MKVADYSRLIEGFRGVQSRDLSDVDRFRPVLNRFRELQLQRRVQRQSVAPSFNVLGVFKLTFNEVRHSMALGWLLDWNPERFGTHGQGDLGLRLFLDAAGMPKELADGPYTVNRDQPGKESNIDVEVVCRKRFVIHIENKIHAADGYQQARRESDDLKRRANSLCVPSDKAFGLYLTPDGRPHECDFRALSWFQIAEAFEAFARQTKPEDVKVFALHFADCIRHSIVKHAQEPQDGESELE